MLISSMWELEVSACLKQFNDGMSQVLCGASDRTRGNRHKIKHLNMRKNFFTVTVPGYWSKFPRKPSLHMFESHLDTILSNPR